MAITRIAKGTAQSKAANTSLTIPSVSMTAGDYLVVGLAYETDAALNTVQYGNKEMGLVANSGVTQGDTRVRLYRKRIHKTSTRDIVATWAGNMSARAMFATALTEVSKKDVGSTNTHTAGTTAPTTGTAVTSTVADTISIAAFASGGPSGDTAGTAGVGHTLGQRVGTTGGGASTNVTIQETYEILSATGNVRATLTGATGRIWATTIAAFRALQTFTITDVEQAHRDQNENPDWVVLHLEDEANLKLRVEIDPVEFDDLSDAAVTEKVTEFCTNYSERLDGESTIDEDSARDTRMATFINDVIVI